MIIPNHWAESRQQQKIDGRQWTIRRFGWSDRSMEEAQAMADQRVAEALKRVVAGETILAEIGQQALIEGVMQ